MQGEGCSLLYAKERVLLGVRGRCSRGGDGGGERRKDSCYGVSVLSQIILRLKEGFMWETRGKLLETVNRLLDENKQLRAEGAAKSNSTTVILFLRGPGR